MLLLVITATAAPAQTARGGRGATPLQAVQPNANPLTAPSISLAPLRSPPPLPTPLAISTPVPVATPLVSATPVLKPGLTTNNTVAPITQGGTFGAAIPAPVPGTVPLSLPTAGAAATPTPAASNPPGGGAFGIGPVFEPDQPVPTASVAPEPRLQSSHLPATLLAAFVVLAAGITGLVRK